jgi:hypothetical protein
LGEAVAIHCPQHQKAMDQALGVAHGYRRSGSVPGWSSTAQISILWNCLGRIFSRMAIPYYQHAERRCDQCRRGHFHTLASDQSSPDIPESAAPIDSGFTSAAPGWVVLRAGALRLAAVEVALGWEAPGSAVLFGAAPCESDLSPEAVSRVVLLPAVFPLASELQS